MSSGDGRWMEGLSIHSPPLAGGARGGAGARQRAEELAPHGLSPEFQESYAPAGARPRPLTPARKGRGNDLVGSAKSATESKAKLRIGQQTRPGFPNLNNDPM